MIPLFIKTFGCKVNYTESVALADLAREAGFMPLEFSSASFEQAGPAPLVFINSCCVTKEAERKAAQFVRRLKRDRPDAVVLFSGCAARNDAAAGKYRDAGARLFAFHLEAFEWLKENTAGRSNEAGPGGLSTDTELTTVDEPETPFESGFVGMSRSRVFLKVQDGCHNHCSFCIIPHVRPYRSRPLDEVLAEVERRLGEGYCELVLTGINIGHYGMAPAGRTGGRAEYTRIEGHPDFCGLVEAVLAMLPETARLRISSIEPEDLGDRFFDLLTHPRMCRHIHLPLQSGSDAVLKAMNRRYSVAEYVELAGKFRRVCPDGALTTDVLVGFPTETDADFKETLELCEGLQFERIHGFPFSPRPGTPAAGMKQLPRDVVQERNRRLIGHCWPVCEQRWRRFVGEIVDVLIEERDQGWVKGHGGAYQIVRVNTLDAAPGSIVPVRLVKYQDGGFVGELN